MQCMILGDSIAAGVALAMPECRSRTMVGVGSARFTAVNVWQGNGNSLTVISLGANDTPLGTNSNYQLRRLRAPLRGQVVWLLPAKPDAARKAILTVAATWHDRYVDTAPYVGSDGLHPGMTGYRAIAREAIQ